MTHEQTGSDALPAAADTAARGSNEPALRNPSEVLRQVFGAHGRRRYESGAAEFNGACALIQPSEAFERACAAGEPVSDLYGPGAVWAWFVGSPRAFTFGFVGSSGWATRKMRSQLAAEYKAVTNATTTRTPVPHVNPQSRKKKSSAGSAELREA